MLHHYMTTKTHIKQIEKVACSWQVQCYCSIVLKVNKELIFNLVTVYEIK